MAYQLLASLCHNNPQNIKILIECGLVDLMRTAPEKKSQNNYGYSSYYVDDRPRSSYGYSGLRNLGCICYMNAMNQQFFLTKPFRYAILMAQDHVEKSLATNKKNKEIDDNVLHQIQKMFGHLELSDREYFDPEQYCFTFKDWENKPVNVSI